MSRNNRIIGGMFGLPETVMPVVLDNPMEHLFLKEPNLLLANARSGISLLVELLSPSQVWMPSYLCKSILNAVDRKRTAVRFYEVNYDLAVPSLEWCNDVQKNDLVILIDYFGFPCDTSCVTRAKEQGAWVLEDASQALLSEVERPADFVLFSPRKFIGVPDGGILVVNHRIKLDNIKLQSPSAAWWLKAFSASILRREFNLYGGKERWFELSQEVNAECPIGGYSMSELSRVLLRHSFDYSIISQKRIENYRFLANLLGDIALFPTLPLQVVPLGFPIRVKNRDRVRQKLFDHQIYPPVHWPIRDIVPGKFGDSHRLADEIMTLPCDQRYNGCDMKRMIQVMCEALG